MIFWVIFLTIVYMTLLMTAWCKSKFTMWCKHVIVYCGWHVWLQSTMTAWGHKLKVSISSRRTFERNDNPKEWKKSGHLSKRKIIHYPGLVISLRLGVTQAMSACQWLSVVWTEILNICDLENCESTLKQDINWIY